MRNFNLQFQSLISVKKALKWIRKSSQGKLKRGPRHLLWKRNSTHLRVGGRRETSQMTSSSGFRLDEPRKIRRTRAAARARPISPAWYKATFNGRDSICDWLYCQLSTVLRFVKIDTGATLSPDFALRKNPMFLYRSYYLCPPCFFHEFRSRNNTKVEYKNHWIMQKFRVQKWVNPVAFCCFE